MKRIALLFTIIFMGCEGSSYSRSDDSIRLGNILKKNAYKYIDFSSFQAGDWKKVCFLGPYNTQSAELLGFEWDISKHTDVLMSDGHNVILFSTDSEVINYIVHNRGHGDFWQLSGQCFNRHNSKLYKAKESGAWYSDE